jgi:hypothetical protein
LQASKTAACIGKPEAVVPSSARLGLQQMHHVHDALRQQPKLARLPASAFTYILQASQH